MPLQSFKEDQRRRREQEKKTNMDDPATGWKNTKKPRTTFDAPGNVYAGCVRHFGSLGQTMRIAVFPAICRRFKFLKQHHRRCNSQNMDFTVSVGYAVGR